MSKIYDFGSQEKSEMARSIRAERRRGYEYSKSHKRGTSYRYLTAKELEKWQSTLDRIMQGQS